MEEGKPGTARDIRFSRYIWCEPVIYIEMAKNAFAGTNRLRFEVSLQEGQQILFELLFIHAKAGCISRCRDACIMEITSLNRSLDYFMV